MGVTEMTLTCVQRGEELFASRNTGNRVTAVTTCKQVPADEREEAVERFVKAKLDQMSVSRTRHRGAIGVAEWLVDRRLALVSKSRGSIGFKEDGRSFLTPFQTISVIESQDFEVTLNGLPLSLEEAYPVCLTCEKDFDVYRVYASLKKQGLRVWEKKVGTSVTGDARTREKESRNKRNIADREEMGHCSERKRRRKNSASSFPSNEAVHMMDISNLKLSDVRHREFVVPPIHEHMKSTARNWTQYKEMTCCSDQDFIGRVIDLSEGLGVDVSHHLPSSVLSSGVTKCVNRFHEIQSLPDLCANLQNHGPKCFSGEDPVDLMNSVSLHFQTDEAEDGNVVICGISDPLPTPDMIHALTRKALLILAVVDESLISFFRFTSLDKWQQLPRMWLRHVE